jgi:hypothetical protein
MAVDVSDLGVRIPVHPRDPFLVFCVRRQRSLRQPLAFSMVQDGAAVLCAKFRGRRTVAIGAGADFHHRSSGAIARLLIDRRRSGFRLIDDSAEREVMLIGFSLPRGRGTPRDAGVAFTQPVEGVPARLASRDPVKGTGGWRLDMGGRFARGSIKNAVMVDGGDREFMVARMIADEEMEVEGRPQIGQLRIFAFALASFICHV